MEDSMSRDRAVVLSGWPNLVMGSKSVVAALVVVLLVAVALAHAAHEANKNDSGLFETVKGLFVHEGKINALNTGASAVIALILVLLVR